MFDQAASWTGRFLDQNFRFFVGGAAALAIAGAASLASTAHLDAEASQLHAAGGEVASWRDAAGTDLTPAPALGAAFELVDDNVLDPIVRQLSRHAVTDGQRGTQLTGTIGMKDGYQLTIRTSDGVVHEIIGAQGARAAENPELLRSLSTLVGKKVTLVGFLDPLDPFPAKDFVAWSLLAEAPGASSPPPPSLPTETTGVLGVLGRN